MKEPYLSIVIPTRDSAATLRHTLETLRERPVADSEVVIADNSTNELTHGMVSALGIPGMRYVRSSGTLAMSENWEAGVDAASGEYIMVVGSDDGVLPGALEHLAALLRVERPQAVRWEQVSYIWPDAGLTGCRDRISIPLERKALYLVGRRIARSVVNGVASFSMLPTIYLGALHRDLLLAMRGKAGRVFAGSCPDVFSGFSAAFASRKYLSLSYPLTVAGVSGRSNGISVLNGTNGSIGDIGLDFRRMNRLAGLVCHAQVPDVPATSAIVADMYLRATEHLGVPRPPRIDRKGLVTRCVGEINCESEAAKLAVFESIQRSFDDNRRLQRWFERGFAEGPRRVDIPPVLPDPGIHGSRLVLDARRFGSTDVHGASRLVAELLGRFPNARDLRPDTAGIGRRLRSATRSLLRG